MGSQNRTYSYDCKVTYQINKIRKHKLIISPPSLSSLHRKLFFSFPLCRIELLLSLSHLRLCDPMDCSTPGFLVLHYIPLCSNSGPLSWWCHPTILSSVTLFSSWPQHFPKSGVSPMSQLFTSGGQSIGASASATVLPMNIQGWFPLGLTGLISLMSKGLLKVFFNTTVWKHQFFSAQLSLWSNSHTHT